jgi:hypothetical protein
MPRGDGTGPAGMGPMTGRAAGFCAAYGMPGYANPVPGRGFGMGFGRGRGFGGGGRGWRHWFYATGLPGWARFGGYAVPDGYATPYQRPDPELERTALRNQAEALQSELDLIKKRMSEIEAASQAE